MVERSLLTDRIVDDVQRHRVALTRALAGPLPRRASDAASHTDR
jgi:hypothetical protein